MSLEPSITRYPLDSTCVTRAVRVVVRVMSRLVVADPSSAFFPDRFARLAQGPPARTLPPKAPIDAVALEARADLVAPLDTAEALSATRMVTESSTRLARSSRVRSTSGAPADQIEPGAAPAGAAAPRRASWI